MNDGPFQLYITNTKIFPPSINLVLKAVAICAIHKLNYLSSNEEVNFYNLNRAHHLIQDKYN